MSTLVGGEATGCERNTMNELIGKCMRENAKFVDGTHAETMMARFTDMLNRLDSIMPGIPFGKDFEFGC